MISTSLDIEEALVLNTSTSGPSPTTHLDDTSTSNDVAFIVLIAAFICFVCVVVVGCYWNPRKREQKAPDSPDKGVHHPHHCASPPIIIDESYIKMDRLKLSVYRHNSNHSHRSSRLSFSHHRSHENGVFDLKSDLHGHDAMDDVNLSETIETGESFSQIEVGVVIQKRDTRTASTLHGYGGIETFDTDDLEDLAEMQSEEESVSDQLLFTANDHQNFLQIPVPGRRPLQMDDLSSTHL